MNAMINKSTEDIIYAGIDAKIVQAIRRVYPNISFRQISDYEELKSYLQDRMIIFECSRGLGVSGLQLQKGLYPRVTLVAPDLPEFKDSKKLLPVGPGIVDASRSALRFVESYVLANDEAYETNKKGLRSFCEREKVPVIKESELEQRLAEILK
jgi:hypothetical protein